MSGIDPGYRHAPKHVTQGEPIEPDGAVLKWYAVHPADRPVPDELTRLARTFLMKTSLEARGLGFVLLHRGKDFYFLIVCTWRNSNELWETVFYKNEDAMADFAPHGDAIPITVHPRPDERGSCDGVCHRQRKFEIRNSSFASEFVSDPHIIR